MPAGQRLKYRSNIEKYSSFVFELIDKNFVSRALKNKQRGISSIIIAGLSYGQGSSREHAALCPAYLGVKAVVAKSIERIHLQNLINFGIIPFYFSSESDYEHISQGDKLKIKDIKKDLAGKCDIYLLNETKNIKIKLKHGLTEEDIQILIKGGKLNYNRY
jgi:aconitate hydratase